MKGAWIAIGPDGKARAWTLSHRRQDTMQAATETMMGANDYHRLPNRSERWSHCYRRGCRIVSVTVTIKDVRRRADAIDALLRVQK